MKKLPQLLGYHQLAAFYISVAGRRTQVRKKVHKLQPLLWPQSPNRTEKWQVRGKKKQQLTEDLDTVHTAAVSASAPSLQCVLMLITRGIFSLLANNRALSARIIHSLLFAAGLCATVNSEAEQEREKRNEIARDDGRFFGRSREKKTRRGEEKRPPSLFGEKTTSLSDYCHTLSIRTVP